MNVNNPKNDVKRTIKVPLQGKGYNGRRVYAYLRRSTSKEEQSESLLQQDEGITFIAKYLGIDLKDIVFFEETRSGFENRTRPEWKKLLQAVDSNTEGAIILCRDTSRLSRNPRDNMAIADRIFGDNKKKKTICAIFFLSGHQIQEWNERTDKKYIVDKLHQNYTESIETKQKSISGVLLKLQQGIYPYSTPKGLEKVKMPDGRMLLKQSEDMPYIVRAFEMKAKGETHEKISKYLSVCEVNIKARDLSERLFRNSIYVGEYTEKTTGEFFDNILFLEGKPPVSKVLWKSVQASFSKRNFQYGKKYEDDIMATLLRTTEGRRMSPYVPSGKTAKQYKNTMEKVHISEREILKQFLEVVARIIFEWWKFYNILITEKVIESYENKRKKDVENEMLENHIDKLYATKEFLMMRRYDAEDKEIHKQLYDLFMTNKAKEYKEVEGKKWVDMIVASGDDNEDMVMIKEKMMENIRSEEVALLDGSIEMIRERLRGSPVFKNTASVNKVKNARVAQLKKDLEKMERDKKDLLKRLVLQGYDKEVVDDMMNDMDVNIEGIREQIDELSQGTEYDVFLQRLPDILTETFELSISSLRNEENSVKKENILKLLEMTTFELSIDNKKELKIKLFEVVDTLLRGGLSGLEAPAGVEPASKALQASV